MASSIAITLAQLTVTTGTNGMVGSLNQPTILLSEVAVANAFSGTHSGDYVIASMARTSDIVQGFNQSHSGDWTLTSSTGLYSSGTLPIGALSAAATTTITARFSGTHSGWTVGATATSTNGSSAALAHKGKYTISARTGSYSRANLPTGTVTATAVLGSVGRFAATSRAGTVVSRATINNWARAELIGPAVRALNGGRFAGRNPKGRLLSTASQAVTLTYEGYSVTLIPGELGLEARMTHLTVCPFDHIVRFGSGYFGIGPDGVYELTGDSYDGADIVAVVETAPVSEPANLKRPRAIFVGGRLSADFKAGVKVGESGEYYFGSAVNSGTRNQRALFGRGVQSRYLAFTFTNTDGSDFQLDDITPEIEVLRRTVGGVE